MKSTNSKYDYYVYFEKPGKGQVLYVTIGVHKVGKIFSFWDMEKFEDTDNQILVG